LSDIILPRGFGAAAQWVTRKSRQHIHCRQDAATKTLSLNQLSWLDKLAAETLMTSAPMTGSPIAATSLRS